MNQMRTFLFRQVQHCLLKCGGVHSLMLTLPLKPFVGHQASLV